MALSIGASCRPTSGPSGETGAPRDWVRPALATVHTRRPCRPGSAHQPRQELARSRQAVAGGVAPAEPAAHANELACGPAGTRPLYRPMGQSRSGLPLVDERGRETTVARIGVTGPCVLAVSRGCFHAAPIATPGAATGVGDRINTHVRRSRRQARRSASAWTSLLLWIAQGVPGGLERSRSRTTNRKRASVCQRRLMPIRSGAAEGVGDGRRPAPVQIDHSRRRGPFSGS